MVYFNIYINKDRLQSFKQAKGRRRFVQYSTSDGYRLILCTVFRKFLFYLVIYNRDINDIMWL